MVTVSCEHSPVFKAHVDSEGLLTLDFSVMQSVLEWSNSLTNTSDNQAYLLPDQRLFVFPTENGEWETTSEELDGTYLAPDWLSLTDACPECLCYVPCDCEPDLVTETDLKAFESQALMGNIISTPDLRRLIYTLREVELQLACEQEVHT
jgi:hypothetical protein